MKKLWLFQEQSTVRHFLLNRVEKFENFPETSEWVSKIPKIISMTLLRILNHFGSLYTSLVGTDQIGKLYRPWSVASFSTSMSSRASGELKMWKNLIQP